MKTARFSRIIEIARKQFNKQHNNNTKTFVYDDGLPPFSEYKYKDPIRDVRLGF